MRKARKQGDESERNSDTRGDVIRGREGSTSGQERFEGPSNGEETIGGKRTWSGGWKRRMRQDAVLVTVH